MQTEFADLIETLPLNTEFADLIETLPVKLKRLCEMLPLKYGELPCNMPGSGVYLFTEDGRPLYVGRSNRLKGRYFRHCRRGATDRQASFAFQLARQETGRTKPSYKSDEGSHKGLMRDPAFVAAFDKAKSRVRAMEYRYVEEPDANKQVLLEIYCAIVLKTPYNDFKTH